MNEELRQRLKAAAREYATELYSPNFQDASISDFCSGAEWLYAELFSEKPAVSSATINIRPTSEKMTAFKDTIKKKYHLSATDADLITGRVEMLLAEQRKEIVEQACEWIRYRRRYTCDEWLDKECDDFSKAMNNQNK